MYIRTFVRFVRGPIPRALPQEWIAMSSLAVSWIVVVTTGEEMPVTQTSLASEPVPVSPIQWSVMS